MDNRPILFIDSGIGGIPYCRDFIKKNPNESVCYLADNKNFPYGPCEKEKLKSILVKLTEKLLEKIKPKIIVVACNTATIAALPLLRQNFSQVPFVGTVPAVRPAAEACNYGKVGVLATERTIEEIHSLNLTDNKCEIFGVAAPDLVDFIELHFDSADEKEKTDIVRKYIKLFREANVDSLVLGCTHFLFLLEEFRREASPFIEVFDSLAGVTKRIEHLLDENNLSFGAGALRAEKDSSPVYRLLLTKDETDSSLWQTRAQKTGFNLVLFD